MNSLIALQTIAPKNHCVTNYINQRNTMKRFISLFIFSMLVLMNSASAQLADPRGYDVINARGTITLDGNMTEAAWGLIPNALLFGAGATATNVNLPVTGGALVKPDPLHGYDTTITTLKMIKQGMKLYIGFSSTDKQVCKFGDSWEGDGLFMKIKNAASVDKEYKLYFNANGVNPNIVFENQAPGAGVGVKGTNTVVNDTTQIDNGYSAEMLIYLDSLGYTADVKTIEVMINIFDPDYYHNGMLPWGTYGSFHKTWWGSEWGPVMRKINFLNDPDELIVPTATTPITVDGNLYEIDWQRNYTHLVFGPMAPSTAYAKSVTGGVLVKGNGIKDTTWTYLRAIRNGTKLYLAFYSNDASVCKFGDSWEGDGLFMKIKNSAGAEKEFKLYWNASGVNPNMVYEATNPTYGAGAGVRRPGTLVNDTTQTDYGYTAELVVYLDSLGFNAATPSVQVMVNIFDPDGYHNGVGAWGPAGQFHKTWWGSEWGPVYRTLVLSSVTTPVELTSFNASTINGSVILDWSTATETNNKGFEIQRSENNSAFVNIGFVSGNGTSTDFHKYQFVDSKVDVGKAYQYRLRQVDFDGRESFSKVIELSEVVPLDYSLSQNYPNPFNPSTAIKFAVPAKSNVVINLYNTLGQQVKTLVSGSHEAGTYTVNFDAADFSTGVYVYTISAQGADGKHFFTSKKMNLIK